ncbi:MAG: InlB B-repeat-containing protein, partial [archaeon]
MNKKLIPLVLIGLLLIGLGCLNDVPIDEGTENELIVNVEGEGIVDPEEGTHNYTIGENITMEATPEEGYEFTGWTGDIESNETIMDVEIEEDLEVTANFQQIEEDDDEQVDVGEPGETVLSFLEKTYEGNIEETAEYLVEEEAEQFEQELENMSEEELQQIKMMMEETDVETTVTNEEVNNGEAKVDVEMEISTT